MPSVPDKKTSEPEKKPAKITELPPKHVSDDSSAKIKGGIAGPCDSPKRRQ